MKTFKHLFFFVVLASLYLVPANVTSASVPLVVHDNGKVLQVMIFRGEKINELEAKLNHWLRTADEIYSVVSIIPSESARSGGQASGEYYGSMTFSITVIYYKKV